MIGTNDLNYREMVLAYNSLRPKDNYTLFKNERGIMIC